MSPVPSTIYEWGIHGDVPNRLIGEEDIDKSPNYIDWFSGVPKSPPDRPFIIRWDVPWKRIEKLDILSANVGLPLVNNRTLEVIHRLDPDSYEVLPSDLATLDGPITGFNLLNLTKNVPVLDRDRSSFSTRVYEGYDAPQVVDIRYWAVKRPALRPHHLARMSEMLSWVVISKELRDAFREAKINNFCWREPNECV